MVGGENRGYGLGFVYAVDGVGREAGEQNRVGDAASAIRNPPRPSRRAPRSSAKLSGRTFSFCSAVALAIYASAGLSGAHLNPAVSLAFAVFRRDEFGFRRLPLYWTAQLAGAILAGLTSLAIFGPFIARFESDNGIIRGADGSQLSAMVFGEYFPNPAIYGTGADAAALISPLGAAVVEGFGTAILTFVIFALTDRRNAGLTAKPLTPLLIGFTVAALISLFAPLTQAGWNPARDFGPRLIAYFAGWGEMAIPGPRAGFWAYIIGPLIGAPLGAALHEMVAKRSG